MAHRGDAVHAPENSPSSFRLALERGADALETDLWRTQDGVLVCHHDRDLDRTTDSTGAIPELALAEVKRARVIGSYCGRYDQADYPDERIMTLGELLATVPKDKGLALELKDPALEDPENARQLVETVRDRIAGQTVMLLSFHTELLRAAQRANPDVWVGKIGMFAPFPFFRGNGIGTTWPAMKVNPLYTWIARLQGLWVCPLDPTPEERIPWYLKLGVDAVLTDDPARTCKALGRSPT
jgi:glycerophosphoryl diester phosphodiesterase